MSIFYQSQAFKIILTKNCYIWKFFTTCLVYIRIKRLRKVSKLCKMSKFKGDWHELWAIFFLPVLWALSFPLKQMLQQTWMNEKMFFLTVNLLISEFIKFLCFLSLSVTLKLTHTNVPFATLILTGKGKRDIPRSNTKTEAHLKQSQISKMKLFAKNWQRPWLTTFLMHLCIG